MNVVDSLIVLLCGTVVCKIKSIVKYNTNIFDMGLVRNELSINVNWRGSW